jgi:hypothetical protein
MSSPTVSVVVETDNLKSADSERAKVMLTELAAQAHALDKEIEVLIFYNPDEIERSLVQQFLSESGLTSKNKVATEICDARGLLYYELKNVGASRARSPLVVFIDSDVIPEKGWLRNLIGPFSDPKVQVAVASPYVPVSGTYDKTFALFWNFPLRQPDGPIFQKEHLFANSMAVRRSVFEHYRFPEEDRYRGQCESLARRLRADGIAIWQVPNARVEHPPPKGFMIRRALWKGHDLFFDARRSGDPRRYSFVGSLRMLGSYAKQSTRRIIEGRQQVNLSPAAVPGALAIAGTYVTASWIGFVIARINAKWLRRFASL